MYVFRIPFYFTFNIIVIIIEQQCVHQSSMIVDCFSSSLTSFRFEDRDIVFKETITGLVEKENFTYFFMDSENDILLNLTSIVGDCDLYVSQSSSPNQAPQKPNTFDIYSYDLHSATCGQDIVYIDNYIRRPFCIGIYAHFTYDVCRYQLTVIGYELLNNSMSNYFGKRFEDFTDNSIEMSSQNDRQQFTDNGRFDEDNNRRIGDDDDDNEDEKFDSFTHAFLNILLEFVAFFLDIIIF
ncbi:uncharacterized protein LOC142645500 [Dermatophagoides pteronyssinus]|uniref:uncharacterized protein LOC142645500 n=1 Tax=Dermatophagoides pteronyssinus TaxID=6956 RepID=UPI003F66F925